VVEKLDDLKHAHILNHRKEGIEENNLNGAAEHKKV
jgi:hypothetical protein